jgi:penicillin-binding protein 1A
MKGEKDTIMTPMDSIRYYKHSTIWTYGYGPQTGNIKAWVGGIDYKYFSYDHVGQGARQGLYFKPFVYATITIEHVSMRFHYRCPTMPVGRHHVTEAWTPRNSNKYIGMVTLKKH